MIRPSRMRKARYLAAFSLVALLLGGCGAGSKEPGGSSGSISPAQTDNAINFSAVPFTASLPDTTALLSGGQQIGTVACATCHGFGSPIQALTVKSNNAAAAEAGWLSGPHANYESINLQTFQTENRGPDNTGLPFYGFEGFGTDPSCVTNCHDPLGEGRTLAANYAATGNAVIGKADRPFIGCEACHGGGGQHFGTAALPVARPNALRCGRCHNASFPQGHLTYHPEGGNIAEDYLASGHSRSINSHNYVEGSTTDVASRCSRCHTDEGAQTYVPAVNGTESYDELKTKMTGRKDVANAAVVQCRTCHDKHNPDLLLGSKASYAPGSLAATTWSDEFKTCTLCHQLLKENGTVNAAAYHDPAVNQYGDAAEIITDTHYDDPATPEIEGYVLNPASTHSGATGNTNSGTCRDCHNPHKADTTIQRQWAQSAHGGFLATVKDSKGKGAVQDATAPAWAHYDFKQPDRADCQRCHTSTGFRNMANNPAAYNPSGNQFVATGNQKEMLYCWGCHLSNNGILRNPGQFVLPSSYAFPQERAFPANLSGSFLCVNCHSGRETGQFIKNTFTVSGIAGKSFGSFNSHYLAAGGIMFRTIGYEFSGKDYSNTTAFKHDTIGVVVQGTGTNGPCVGCHMKSSESHRFEAAVKGADGSVIDIPALGTVCIKCHGVITDPMSPARLTNLDAGFLASLEVLQDSLAAKGIHYDKNLYPYFFTTSDVSLHTNANAYTAWASLDVVGAAFNLNLLAHQPGAFVHNSAYTKRLIYDSLDLLDDGNLNSSVQAYLQALTGSNRNVQVAASFLLNQAGGRP